MSSGLFYPSDYTDRIAESVTLILGIGSQLPDGAFSEIVAILCQEFPNGGDPSIMRPRINQLVTQASTAGGEFQTTDLGQIALLSPLVGSPLIGPGNAAFVAGNGSPEGVVTAPVGSIFLRLDGAGGTTLYVKESGTGNTGWTAVSSGGGAFEAGCNVGPDGTIGTTVPGPGFLKGCTVVWQGIGTGLYAITLDTPRAPSECILLVDILNAPGFLIAITHATDAIKSVQISDLLFNPEVSSFNFALFVK
jgi:hypothetical protein